MPLEISRTPTWLRLLRLALLSLLLGSASLGAAQIGRSVSSAPWPTFSESTQLSNHLEYAVEQEGGATVEDVLQGAFVGDWQHFTGDTPSFGFTSDVYWFRIRLAPSPIDAEPAFLHIGYPLLDRVELYLRQADTNALHTFATLGDRQPFNTRAIDHRHFVFDIPPSESERDILIRIKTSSSMNVPLKLVNQRAFLSNNEGRVIAFGLLFGSMLIMVLYNIIIFSWTRETNYLTYCLYALSMVLFFLSFEGFGFQYLWPDSMLWHEKSIVVLVSLTVAGAVKFNLGFLSLKEEYPRAYPLGLALIGLLIVNGIVGFFIPYSLAIRSTIGILLPSGIFAMGTGFVLLQRGFHPARYYLISWVAVIVGGFALGLNRVGVIPVNVFTDNILLVGATAQLMLLSYALADRVNQIKAEKERIQLKALDAQLKASAELKIALDKAEEASKLKSEFLANISHELRTPLNAIVNLPGGMLGNFEQAPMWHCGACDAQFQSENASDVTPPVDFQPECPECSQPLQFTVEPTFIGDPEEQIHFLQRIETAGRHLLGVVNDLLDISKLEADRVRIYPEPFPVMDLLREVDQAMRGLAEAKRITLDVPVEPRSLTLDADRIKVSQILINLIGNAIKFTPEKGTIGVSVAEDTLNGVNAIRFEVRDTGTGIPQNALKLIFESFRQVDGSHTRRHQGTGLGLAITRQLVDLHGGTIDVESEVGVGSTFRFILPLVQTDQGPNADQESEPLHA